MEKFIFCALICASKQTENYCEEENNLFFKNCVVSLFLIFEKVFAICNFFYRSVFRRKVLRLFCILFIWSSIHSIGIFFFILLI